jgi:hypothetical protein
MWLLFRSRSVLARWCLQTNWVTSALLRRNLFIYGIGGVIIPLWNKIDWFSSVIICLKIEIMKKKYIPTIRLNTVLCGVFFLRSLHFEYSWNCAIGSLIKGKGEITTVNRKNHRMLLRNLQKISTFGLDHQQ